MRNSSVAMGAAIRAVNANFEDGVNGYEVEIAEFGECFGTDDFTEGSCNTKPLVWRINN